MVALLKQMALDIRQVEKDEGQMKPDVDTQGIHLLKNEFLNSFPEDSDGHTAQ